LPDVLQDDAIIHAKSDKGTVNMTSKELIKATINFQGPTVIPYDGGVPGFDYFDNPGTPEQQARIKELTSRAQSHSVGFWTEEGGSYSGTDENGLPVNEDSWGIRWVSTHGTARVVSHPLAGGIPDDYSPPPLPSDALMQQHRTNAQANPDKYLTGFVWFTLFEHLWFLRGFEQTLMDLYDRDPATLRLLDKIFQRVMACIRKFEPVGVDGIFFSDDWGSQRGLLINPELWREIFKPLYTQMFAQVHAQGMQTWMHLCGNIIDIVPDLIEAGLDVLNPLQPMALNLDDLAAKYGGQIACAGGIDVQGTLVWGTPADVRKEVRHHIDTLAVFNGGYIPGPSHTIMPETPMANIIAMLEALEEFCATPPKAIK
jgi:uroporphyrinogen decarboxylase